MASHRHRIGILRDYRNKKDRETEKMRKAISTDYRPSIVLGCDNKTLNGLCRFILGRSTHNHHYPDIVVSLLACASALFSRHTKKGA